MKNKYGNRIRTLRELHKETLETFASKVGLTLSALGKYERGDNSVHPEVLEVITKVYDVPISYFFDNTTELNKRDIIETEINEWEMLKVEMEKRKITPTELIAFLSFLSKLKETQ
jgi:transcriptional regulator with XRE-family HTH domain